MSEQPETLKIKRQQAFRNYLHEHPAVATAYAAIKLALAKQFPHDATGYQDAKGSFIRAIDYRTGHAREDQLQAKDEVVLLPYDSGWPKLAAAEIEAIKNTVPCPFLSIHHLGSTAIPGMAAKPILDIFIGVESMQSADCWTEPLQNLGYVDWPENPNKQHARFFKGMPPFGTARTHHVHIMENEKLKERIAFCEKLRESKNLRNEYAELKTKLVQENPQDREAYTDKKAAFIRRVLSSI